jgi:hypothetical protein
MTDRRTFLSMVTGSIAGIVARPSPLSARVDAPTVTAESTPFYRQPDGQASLVRFLAAGIDAPAGRLRVYDRGRRLLGTAGVLRSNDGLFGELWLRVEDQSLLVSELEAPGIRGIHRTTHRLSPAPRWTLIWLTITDPVALERRLDEIPMLNQAVLATLWREAGVTVNPLPSTAHLATLDHVEFLRLGGVGRNLERRIGIRTSSVALVDVPDRVPPTAAMALAGSGVRHVIRREPADGVARWWESPDGTRLVTTMFPAGADPQALAFTDSQDVMARRVETFLSWSPSAVPVAGGSGPMTFVLGTETDDTLAAMLLNVREWNRRFAYPHIVIGGSDDLHALLPTEGVQPFQAAVQVGTQALPSPGELTALVDERRAAYARRVESMLLPIATVVGGDRASDPLGTLAAAIDTTFPGHLVVNPAPHRRTDVVTLAEGRTVIVTDVPPLGHAFILEPPGSPADDPAVAPLVSRSLSGAVLRLELDDRTGAINLLRDRRTGREWARVAGLNTVDGSILQDHLVETVAGVGTRLTAWRRSPRLGAFTSVVTVYDALPRIDIENVAVEAIGVARYEFAFALPYPLTRWEIPAGHRGTTSPVEGAVHLRWIALQSGSGVALFRGIDAPHFDVDEDGTVTSHAPADRARYRIATADAPLSVAECARFGWDSEPLVAAPVLGSPTGRIPRFGSPFVLDQKDAAIVGIEPEADGISMIVYLQDLSGTARSLTLGYGLLAFDEARRVDLLGRDIAEPATPVPGGIAVSVRGWGVIAVRLSGLRLR